ncbi:O-antigen ligase family protein [Blastococcus sp. SYSU DS1021]
MRLGLARWVLVLLVVTQVLPWAMVRVPVLAASLAAMALMVVLDVQPGKESGGARLPWAATLFVAWCILTVFWSIDARESALFAAQMVGLFVAACHVAHRLPLEQLHDGVGAGMKLLLASSAAAEVIAGLGFPLHEVSPGTVGAQGLMANPNLLAFASVMATVTIVTLPRQAFRHSVNKLVWVGLAAILVYLSQSDGGLIYLVAAASFASALWVTRGGSDLGPLALVAALLPLPLILVPGVRQFLLDLVGVSENLTLSGRTRIWQVSVEAIGSRPWGGYGIGALQNRDSAPTNAILNVWQSLDLANFNAHNGFLDVALQVGLPGVVLLVLLIGVALASYLRCHRQTSAAVWGSLSLLTLIAYNMTEARLVTPPWAWLLLVLLAAKAVYILPRPRAPFWKPPGSEWAGGPSSRPQARFKTG